MLGKEDFITVVKNTPLVSIDLAVTANGVDMLMGQRVNQPAAGFWFVPGGRIYKSESLEAAFLRITETELGVAYPIGQGKLLGAFTHLYDTNFAEVPGISTHYVVLAYQLNLDIDLTHLPAQQHCAYRRFSLTDDLSLVHPNSQAYFPYLQ